MNICWYSYWGWAKPVADIYREASRRLGGFDYPLHFSPSHAVWEDDNFDDCTIECCLKHFDKYKGGYTDEQLAVARWSLAELLRIPEDARDIVPKDYDGEHPELYPPKAEVVRVFDE